MNTYTPHMLGYLKSKWHLAAAAAGMTPEALEAAWARFFRDGMGAPPDAVGPSHHTRTQIIINKKRGRGRGRRRKRKLIKENVL